MSDKISERKKFEKFMRKETGHCLAKTKYPMTEPEDQQYKDHSVNLAWFAWLARASEVRTVDLQFSQEVPACKDDGFGIICDPGGRPV